MTKPDYNSMTRTELKNYLLEHRTDEEGWSVFFEKLAEENKTAEFYPPIHTMDPEEVDRIIREKAGL